MIMNVKGLMQAEWLTGDGWLFELYTISNILYQVPRGPWLRLHLLPAWRLQRRGPAACCINHPYRIQHLGLRLHSAPFSSLLLISDEIPSPLCRDALRLGTAASRTGWWCDDTVCPNVIETSCRISMNMSLFIEQKPAGLQVLAIAGKSTWTNIFPIWLLKVEINHYPLRSQGSTCGTKG